VSVDQPLNDAGPALPLLICSTVEQRPGIRSQPDQYWLQWCLHAVNDIVAVSDVQHIASTCCSEED
jgi:hypothetical protein